MLFCKSLAVKNCIQVLSKNLNAKHYTEMDSYQNFLEIYVKCSDQVTNDRGKAVILLSLIDTALWKTNFAPRYNFCFLDLNLLKDED